MLGPPHSAPELLATALKSPRAGLRPSFPAVLGLQNRDFSGGKGRATRWVGRLMGIPGSTGCQPAGAGLDLERGLRASEDRDRPACQPAGQGVMVLG